MWSQLRNAKWLEHSHEHFPLHMSSFLLCSPSAEMATCDNRGTISSSSRPCSCKVEMLICKMQYKDLITNIYCVICTIFVICEGDASTLLLFWLPSVLSEMSLSGRWITCLWVCCRTTWQALSAMSVSLASSICLRQTMKAVYVASVWVSPKNVPALLGVEIRWVAIY